VPLGHLTNRGTSSPSERRLLNAIERDVRVGAVVYDIFDTDAASKQPTMLASLAHQLRCLFHSNLAPWLNAIAHHFPQCRPSNKSKVEQPRP